MYYNKSNSILEISADNTLKNEVNNRIISVCEQENNLPDSISQLCQSIKLNKQIGKFYLRDHVIEEISKLNNEDILDYLHYRYAYDVYPLDKIIDKFPPLVQIEPTSICNYRCVFCYQIDNRLTDKKNGHMGVMSMGIFKLVVDQLEGNVEAVTLASRGEPTVNKNLSEMLKYLSGKFLATKVNTNAYLLDEEIIHAILDSDLQTLVFSADSVKDSMYSQLRVNGDLKRVLDNIELFNEIKEKQYPSSKLITRVSGVKFNEGQDLDEMDDFWGHLVDQVMFVDYNPWENIYDAKKNNMDKPCSDLWRRMFVWWDGKVAPCDVDYLTTLSNESVLDKTIPEIWQGKKYTELRDRHLKGERQSMEPCSRCVVV